MSKSAIGLSVAAVLAAAFPTLVPASSADAKSSEVHSEKFQASPAAMAAVNQRAARPGRSFVEVTWIEIKKKKKSSGPPVS
jgi:hypothetical protein